MTNEESEYERGFDDGFILRKEKDEGANKDTGYEYTDGYEDGYKAGMAEKKPWVGLTGTETNHIVAKNVGYPERMMKDVENLLKDKNT